MCKARKSYVRAHFFDEAGSDVESWAGLDLRGVGILIDTESMVEIEVEVGVVE